ncbi:secretin N-terminal domain-containing protein [Pseudomonas oryzihabitans]|uniref:secretin N-terminal domain-containing protein n=1 Tax=Pseudomonas oryzihabitans TaxID=47885 RepID=UPI0011238644|nr:secretin N-terminal domain-containing protein [Pseudomonas psychrotolerans]QDD88687.1 secretin [Pseudomonas psychrotolerans]
MKHLLALLLLLTTCAWAAPRTEVIPLQYRTADDLLPTLQSVLGAEGKINVYGNQLIVNAEPVKIAEIKNLLAQLDTQPRRLLITLATRAGSSGASQGYDVAGDVRSPRVRIIENSTDQAENGAQRVQVTEGYPAFIRFGEDVPVTTYQTSPYGQSYAQTDYRRLERGFQVVARLSGNLVHLDITSVDDRAAAMHPGTVKTQSAATRISGPLGQWLDLGGFRQQVEDDRSGLTRYYSTEGRNDRQLSIRADLID